MLLNPYGCRTKTTTGLLDYVAGRIIRTGLWNLGKKGGRGVAGRKLRTGLWNLGCRTKTTNRTLELCCRTNNTNRTLEFRLPDETTNRTLEFRLPDENYEPDFGIICQTNYTTRK
ncbi:unnamed protein product [Rhizophagus irregularis]|nr:unnamed protein product [Rhizophagus irregularis]